MTTNTAVILGQKFFRWIPDTKKYLAEITIEDMIKAHEEEVETLRELEIENEIDHALVLAENNSKYDYEDNY